MAAAAEMAAVAVAVAAAAATAAAAIIDRHKEDGTKRRRFSEQCAAKVFVRFRRL
jgi:hypothetical protein